MYALALLPILFAQIADLPPIPEALKARFAEFTVRETFHGEPAPVILSRAEERYYRTMLREGAKDGPNFARRYTIVQWGCGTECWQAALVDAKTGSIHPLPSVSEPRFYYFESTWIHFRPDSRLLVMCTNCREWANRECDQRYFVWNGTNFTEVHGHPQHDAHSH
jgi:hypothetical protein